jgi:hypothetical protein
MEEAKKASRLALRGDEKPEKGEILSQQDLDIYNSPQEAVESDIISL